MEGWRQLMLGKTRNNVIEAKRNEARFSTRTTWLLEFGARIPEDDGRNDQIEPACAAMLVLETALPQAWVLPLFRLI
jgi:hypothetical protein